MTLTARKPIKPVSAKPKACAVKACRAKFVPAQPFQTWCSPDCGVLIARAKREKSIAARAKRERVEIKAAKERIKTKAEHAKDAQRAFNEFIRLRDAGQPCISCGTTADVQYCAGHFRTVGACPELRFEPLNVNRQCNKNCNLEKSGNVLEYRIRLAQKIGAEKLAWLEGPHEPKRYTVADLKEIKATYRAKVRELKKELAKRDAVA